LPVATFGDKPEGIRVEQLDIKSGEFKGEWIKGGPLQEFCSTGILDRATSTVLTVQDDLVIVDTLKTNKLLGNIKIQGNAEITGDVNITGRLEVDVLKTKELVAEQRTENQYLEFGHKDNKKSNEGLHQHKRFDER
jgi:hypothetical protein